MKFIYVLPLIFILSCSKSMEIITKKNIVLKQTYPIQNISDKQKGSDIIIETNSYFTEKIIYDNIHLSGALKKWKSDSISLISFNKVSLQWKNKYFDSTISPTTPNQIFGRSLILGLKNIKKENQLKIGYIPKTFSSTNNIQSSVMFTNGEYFKGTILKPNFTLTWEKDSLNKNGIFIYLEFDCKNVGNEKHQNYTASTISNLIFVEDNGLYTLDEKMFEGFPSNSVLSLYIGRTNMFSFQRNREFQSSFQLLTASSCKGDFYYQSF